MERQSGTPATKPGYKQDRDEEGLTKRERQVRRMLGDGWAQHEIADAIGVSKQRVWQIVRALEKKGAVTIEGETVTVTDRSI